MRVTFRWFLLLVILGCTITQVMCIWKGCPLVNYKCAQTCMKKLHTKGRCVGVKCECIDPVFAWAGLQIPYGGFGMTGGTPSLTGFPGLEEGIANGLGYLKGAKAMLPEVKSRIVETVKEIAKPIPKPEPEPEPTPEPPRRPRKIYKRIRQRPIYIPVPVMYPPQQMPKGSSHSYYASVPKSPVYQPPKSPLPPPPPPVYQLPKPNPPSVTKTLYRQPPAKISQHSFQGYSKYPEQVMPKENSDVMRVYARHPQPTEDAQSFPRPPHFEQEETREQYVEDNDPVYENEYDDEEEQTDRQMYYDY